MYLRPPVSPEHPRRQTRICAAIGVVSLLVSATGAVLAPKVGATIQAALRGAAARLEQLETPSHCDAPPASAQSSPHAYAESLATAALCAYAAAKENGSGSATTENGGKTITVRSSLKGSADFVKVTVTSSSTQPGPGRTALPSPSSLVSESIEWIQSNGSTTTVSLAHNPSGIWTAVAKQPSNYTDAEEIITVDEDLAGSFSVSTQMRILDADDSTNQFFTRDSDKVRTGLAGIATTADSAFTALMHTVTPPATVSV